MKNAKPSTSMSKRPRVEASIAASTTGDQPAAVDPTVEEIQVDPITDAKTGDPTITPPLQLHAMMETFMTTQETHGQLIDELLTKVAALRADFTENRSAFPPPPPSDP